jgi:hypothetical protein
MIAHDHPEVRGAEFVVFANEERRYTDCTEAVCRLLGYSRKELLHDSDSLSRDQVRGWVPCRGMDSDQGLARAVFGGVDRNESGEVGAQGGSRGGGGRPGAEQCERGGAAGIA